LRGTAREHADYREFSQLCPIRNSGAIVGRARICHQANQIRREVSAINGLDSKRILSNRLRMLRADDAGDSRRGIADRPVSRPPLTA
jgi:hypothetical protein